MDFELKPLVQPARASRNAALTGLRPWAQKLDHF